jgi:hypothetical protein
MKFVSITSDELKEAILEGNRISIQKQTYDEVRYAVDNPSDVEEYFRYDNDSEKMFFGYVTKGKKNKYVFLLMQNMYSSDTEKCLDSLVNLISSLIVEIKLKSSKIKTLESELESVSAELDLIDEVDKLNDEINDAITEDDINNVSTVSNQVKLPSQKSYITIDNFDMFV